MTSSKLMRKNWLIEILVKQSKSIFDTILYTRKTEPRWHNESFTQPVTRFNIYNYYPRVLWAKIIIEANCQRKS